MQSRLQWHRRIPNEQLVKIAVAHSAAMPMNLIQRTLRSLAALLQCEASIWRTAAS